MSSAKTGQDIPTVTSNNKNNNLAVILLNLGTPDEPTPRAIRRYLSEFLSDPRVVDIPRVVWLPILYLFILTLRPKKLVHKYKLIWGTHDGPIRNITKALARRTQQLISRNHFQSDITVTQAMTYGEPSVANVLHGLHQQGIDDFLFLPLFPQYANATTAAAHDKVCRSLSNGTIPGSRFISDYHQQPTYIDALTKSVEAYSDYLDAGALLIFSFHGIPQAQADNGDPYEAQCRRTAQLVTQQLGLSDDAWRLSFQSRFGLAKWLTPYTSELMASVPLEGNTKILIICPGFATDCLETIEEIKILNKGIFLEAGGQEFRYVRALNASANHAKMVVDIVTKHLFAREIQRSAD